VTDVYRTSGLPCPVCKGASLRTLGNRYICDECNGMLIEEDELEQALTDLTGEPANPRTDYGARSPTLCPRCERAFVEVELVLELSAKRVPLDQPFLRCERDGLWCAGGVLEAVFERVGKKSSRGVERSYDAEPAIGPDGLPERRFATSIPRIRRTPRPSAPAVDPFADRALRCPTCVEQVLVWQDDRWTCLACTGALIPEPTLVALTQDIKSAYWELPPIGLEPGARPCPVCTTPLRVGEVEGVAVDRCADHGVWFEGGELQHALANSARPPRSWLGRLLSRD
jgi:Zn-finger nucleic acid-binding protein